MDNFKSAKTWIAIGVLVSTLSFFAGARDIARDLAIYGFFVGWILVGIGVCIGFLQHRG